MRRHAWLLGMAWITVAAPAPATPPVPIELNGQYDFLPDPRPEAPAKPPAGTPWGRCHVPALWWEAQSVGEGWRRGDPPGYVTTPYAWYRRTVLVPAERRIRRANRVRVRPVGMRSLAQRAAHRTPRGRICSVSIRLHRSAQARPGE